MVGSLALESSHIKVDSFTAFNSGDHSKSVIIPPFQPGSPISRILSRDGDPVLEQIAGLIASLTVMLYVKVRV